MLTDEEIDTLERNIGQLSALHAELAILAKKSPNDGVNKFKLQFINQVLSACNGQLGNKYRPFETFIQFAEDDLPSNSDVTFMLAQYLAATERLRCDNIVKYHGFWHYNDDNGRATEPPRKLRAD